MADIMDAEKPDKSVDALLPDHSIHETLNVLVAEDNITNQLVILKMLDLLGVHSTLAENGNEAVKTFRKTLQDKRRSPFHVILMDINMPICDGLQATKAIRLIERKSGCQKPVSIVALSAQSEKDSKQLAQQAGMDAYISKPISLADLKTQLSSLAPKKTEPQPAFIIRNNTMPSASHARE